MTAAPVTIDRQQGKFFTREALSTAQAQEPVAYRYERNGVVVLKEKRAPDYLTPGMGCWTETPLYASPPAPSTPDAREVVEQCVAIAVERSQEWKSAIANGLRRVAVSKDYAEAAQCEAEVIAAAIRAKASGIIAALPLPTPSAPDAALREAWQPIETAPKDGTAIIGAYYRGERWDWVLPVSWITEEELAEHEGGVPSDYIAGWDHLGDLYEPTHWMPLPAAPALSNSGQMEKGA